MTRPILNEFMNLLSPGGIVFNMPKSANTVMLNWPAW